MTLNKRLENLETQAANIRPPDPPPDLNRLNPEERKRMGALQEISASFGMGEITVPQLREYRDLLMKAHGRPAS